MHALIRYIRYWLLAVNEHSLHSPFIYNFYTKTIKGKVNAAEFTAIEQIRKELKKSREKIIVSQLGARSRVNNRQLRPVAAIARRGITKAAISQLLYRFIRDHGFQDIVELGTSFGINTMYLAANPNTRVTTFEGCPDTAQIANANFARLSYANIRLIEGNIDQTLPGFCRQPGQKVDLAFVDANHQYGPTVRYVKLLMARCHPNSLIVIDDIYWSAAMTRAWEELKKHPRVTATMDLYTLGILIFRPGLKKEHYILA